MKNIVKNISALCVIIPVFIFSTCSNQLELKNNSSNSELKSGIKITISGDGVRAADTAGARTLFPSEPKFTKYELYFYKLEGNEIYDTVTLNPDKSEILIEDLALGEWEITAIGYITINGNFIRAADGKTIIDVYPYEEGKTAFQSVNIPISARNDGENGVFFYDVDFPGSVNSAVLFIYNIGGSPWDVYDEDVSTPLGENEPVNILTKKSGEFVLAPGYYMMTMKLDNGYKAVSWTEVIHIYSNTITEMIRIFDDSFITGVITLSGSAVISINGKQADWAAIQFFTDANYKNHYTHMDINDGEIFPITMLVFDKPTPLYMKLMTGTGNSVFSRELGFITLYKDDIEFNFNEVFQTISLSGTSNIKINGTNPEQAYIFAYRADNDVLLTPNEAYVDLREGQNGSWEIILEVFSQPSSLYFVINAFDVNYSSFSKRADIVVTAFNQDIQNIFIDIDVGQLMAGGTANLTINGVSPRWANITMRQADNDNWLGHCNIDFEKGNTWIISLNNLSESIDAYFEYECEDINDNYFGGIIDMPYLFLFNVNVTDVVLDIGDIKIVIIDGTANINVNGSPPKTAYVTMYRSSDNVQLGFSYIDLKNHIENDDGIADNPNYKRWKMIIMPPFAVNTGVYFAVSGEDSQGQFFERNVLSRDVYNQNIHGIELIIDINLIEITLSGDVNFIQSFVTPDNDVEIIALVKDGIYYNQIGSTTINYEQGNRNWSLNAMSFGASTTVYFQIRWRKDSDTFVIFTNVTRQVLESGVSGINLGSYTLHPLFSFYENNGEPRWTANINSAWILNGEKVAAGEYYALDYKFTTANQIISDIDVVIRDLTLCECEDECICDYNDSLLSDVRRLGSNLSAGQELSGTVIFSITKNASSPDNWANTFYFMVAGATIDRPAFSFSRLEIRKIKSEESVSTWTIASGQVFDILGPGVTSTAKLATYHGRDNVLYVKPGPGGYYHFVIEYDLSEWEGKKINISLSFDYRLEELVRPPSRVSWRITSSPDSPASYPLICQGASAQNASTSWRSASGNNTITVPETPGDGGKKLYLSSYEITDAAVYFSNFYMTITEQK